MDRALIALCALLLNAVLAGRRWYMPPAIVNLYLMPSRILRDLERKLNREHRGPKELEARGMVLVGAAAAASIVGGLLLGWIFSHLLFLEIGLLMLLLPVRQTWDVTSQIKKSLGNLQQARAALADTPWRHHALLDDHGVARAGIEWLAVQFSEKILSPICWYLLLGLPGLFICRSITLMQETLPSTPFGKGANLAHKAVHYLPARIAAGFWVMGAWFLPSANIQAVAGRIGAAFSRTHPHDLALLSAAGALKLSLGGPSSIYARGAWLGEGTPKASAVDVGRALYLFALLNVFLVVFLGFFQL